MSIIGFRTLITFAKLHSFARTADQMRITQAAVGQRIRKLEEDLGVALVSHETRPPSLTVLGHEFVRKAEVIVGDYDTLLSDLIEGSPFQGEVSIGAFPSAILELVPQTLRALSTEHPDLQFRISVGASSDLPLAVERGLVDLAVTSKPERISPTFGWLSLAQEPLVLIAEPDEPLDNVMELLRIKPFVRHVASESVGQLADMWLMKAKMKPISTMEMTSLDTVVSMISHGLGVSIVPDICVPDDKFARLKRLPLPGAKIAREMGVLYRSDTPRTLVIKAIYQHAELIISKHNI